MLLRNLPAAVSIPQTFKTPTTAFKRLTAFGLALLLLPMTCADLFAQQAPYYPGPQQPYSYSPQYDPGQRYQQPYAQPGYGQEQPGYSESQGLGPAQLDQLVAPIALNPDPLVALMLAASTYPQQVADADQWRQSQGNVPPPQIAYGANLQNWDPSVKALTAFPQVLAEMDQNSQWTGALGNAYYNQPQDVLQAIQIMRQRAQDAGNLQSTPQEDVSDNQGYIQLAPANPQVIYVPAYNPWTAYGQPVSPYPGFSLLGAIGSFFNSGFGSSAVQFGLGTVMSAFNSSPWGLLSWGLNWLTQNLLFNHSDYYSNSSSVSDWGLRYGGPRAFMAPHRELAGYNRNYGRNGYGRDNRNGYGRNFNRENYNRNQQGYGRTGFGSNYRSSYRSSIYNRSQSPYAARANYNGMRNPSSDMRQAYRGNYGNNRSTFDNNRNQSAFNGRSNYGRSNYGSGHGFNRAPSSSFARNDFARNDFQRSNSYRGGDSYRGNSYMGSSGKSSHSGGFHLFGGNHNASSFGGGRSYKAPKYKAPKMHGGGGHSFFGGGHHSGGGGHHSGGHGHHH